MKLVLACYALCLSVTASSATDISAGGQPSDQEEVVADDAPPTKSLRSVKRYLQPSCALGTGPAIYVSSSIGSDTTNDGTSPSNPYATIQHAVNNRSACSTIYVMAGTYQNELYDQGYTHHYKSIVNLSGVSEGLTITNYQNDRPLLQFDGPAGIICQSANPCSNIDISGLEIEGRNAEISFDEAMAHRNSGTTNNRFTGKGKSTGSAASFVYRMSLIITSIFTREILTRVIYFPPLYHGTHSQESSSGRAATLTCTIWLSTTALVVV